MNPLILLAFALASAPDAPSKTLVFEDVVISRTLPATVGCGVRPSWGAIDFTHDGVTTRAYVACGYAEKLPAVGAHCSLTVTVSKINGATPDQRSSAYGAYAVDEIRCAPPITS